VLVFVLIAAIVTVGAQAFRALVADEEGIGMFDPAWSRPKTQEGKRYRRYALYWLALGFCALILWGVFGVARIQDRKNRQSLSGIGIGRLEIASKSATLESDRGGWTDGSGAEKGRPASGRPSPGSTKRVRRSPKQPPVRVAAG
jgi:hypothetical protein